MIKAVALCAGAFAASGLDIFPGFGPGTRWLQTATIGTGQLAVSALLVVVGPGLVLGLL